MVSRKRRCQCLRGVESLEAAVVAEDSYRMFRDVERLYSLKYDRLHQKRINLMSFLKDGRHGSPRVRRGPGTGPFRFRGRGMCVHVTDQD